MRCLVDRVAALQRHAPSVASLGFGLLIVVELLRIGHILLPEKIDYSAPSVKPPARHPVPHVDANHIVMAHLFGVAANIGSEDDPADAPVTNAALTMVGTLATQDPNQGKAIIAADGEFHVYSVGQQIGGAMLQFVYSDHVILDRQGTHERLDLPHSQRIAAHGEHTGGVTMGSVRSPLHTAQPLAPIIETIANSDTETDSMGKFLGIRVVAGKDRSAFNDSGLKSGDVILAINGNRLDESDKSQQMFRQLATGATVTVMRWGGKTQDVTLNLAP